MGTGDKKGGKEGKTTITYNHFANIKALQCSDMQERGEGINKNNLFDN